MKRFAFGCLWFLLFLFGFMVLAAIIIPNSQDIPPEEAFKAGQQHGGQLGLLYLVGAGILAVGGTSLQILPGTKEKQPDLEAPKP